MSEILLNAYSRRPPEYIASHEKLNNYPGKTQISPNSVKKTPVTTSNPNFSLQSFDNFPFE